MRERPEAPVLAIDVGTHATRAALVDPVAGGLRHLTSEDLALNRLGEGRVEQDAVAIAAATRRVLKAVLARAETPPACAALAIQRSTVVAWDRASGEALSPALSWQDTRVAERLAPLADKAEAIHERSGLVLSPHYGAGKLAWLYESLRERNAEGPCLGPLVGFVLHHLLADRPCVCDETNAGRTQLWHWRQRHWDADLCRWFGVPLKHLPTAKPVVADYGLLADADLPLRAVAGDQNAAFWSQMAGASAERALVNAGSGAFVLAPLAAGRAHPDLLAGVVRSDASGADYVLEGTVNGAGTALDWCCDQASDGDRSAFYRQLPQWLATESAPAVFVNGIGGLGSPWWHARGESGFLGESAALSLSQKAVAVLESIVFLLVVNLEAMRRVQPGIQALVATGGLARLDGFCQRLASLSGLPVARAAESEATLLGAAALASGIAPPARSERTFQPAADPALRERYRRALEALQALTGKGADYGRA